MPDDTAFLDALKANPADDTARLVYADWLDEHGEPAKAEYLRAVVDLTRFAGGTREYTDAAVRLFTAVPRIPADWRFAAGGRFDLMLVGCEPTQKINAIRTIRMLTGFGLAEAKALAESVPTPLFSWLPFEALLPSLLEFRTWLDPRQTNAISAELRPTPWPCGAAPDARFEVRLVSYDRDDEWEPQHDNFPREIGFPTRCVARLLAISAEEAVERLRTLPLILKSGLRPAELAGCLREIRMGFNVHSPLPLDALEIIAHPAT